MLAVEPDTCLAVNIRAAQLPPPSAEVVPHERIGHAPDPVAGVRKPPAEVHVGAISEAFVEAADRLKDLAVEGEVDRRTLGEVAGLHGLDRRHVVQPGAALRLQGQARRDVFVLPEGSDDARQPTFLRLAARVREHDDLPAGGPYACIALVRDGDPHARGWGEINPKHRRLVTQPDGVQPAAGRVHHDDLSRFAEVLGLAYDAEQGAIKAFLVFADDDDGDHRWNTSEEPFV